MKFESARFEMSAATPLPTQPPPKVKPNQQALPAYARTASPNTASALLREDRRLINTDITSIRNTGSTPDTIRQFIKASPDLSAAVTSYRRTAITDGFDAVARNLDKSLNAEATAALHQIIIQMDTMNDYTIGFDDSMSLRSVCESWVGELMTYGAFAGELVLNKARLPDKIQPISSSQIEWYPTSDGKRLTPKQKIAGETIDLNTPTFFWVALDQDLRSPYPDSPLESAMQATLFNADFMNDLRKVVKRSIHPRMVVTIDEDKFRKTIPDDIAGDPAKVVEYRNATIASIQDTINNVGVEEALVVFSSLSLDVVDHGNTNLSNEYKVLQDIGDSKMSSGTKTLPTVLGKLGGTANTASAEVLMYVKYVEGAAWGKINEMLSKIFTLAVRLLGHDVYVDMKLKPIELRPQSELESFFTMRQSRILDQLSLGMISDEEASILLTGHLPAPGAPKLSGTMFRAGAGTTAEPAGDGYNGATNQGSAANKSRASDAPTGAKGGQKSAQVVTLAGSQ